MKRRTLMALGLGAALGAFTVLAFGEPPPQGDPPDPPPRASLSHWVFHVDVRDGVLSLGKVDTVTSKQPLATTRVFGRYAIELHVGRELLDRVRFDVPLQGDGARPRDRAVRSPSFEHVTTSLQVRIADNPRATFMELVDRSTGQRTRFLWPPGPHGELTAWDAKPAAPVAIDASADAASPDAGEADGADGTDGAPEN